jgi:hypothetical protein
MPSQPEKKGEREEKTGGMEGEQKSRPCCSSSYNSLSSSLFSAAAFFQQHLYLPVAAAVQEAARPVAAVPTAAIQVAANSRFSSCSTRIAVWYQEQPYKYVNGACTKKKRKK